MPSSDTPSQVEQGFPVIVPKAAPARVLMQDEKPEIERLDDWPLNPYRNAKHPMFARAVFPHPPVIGPLQKRTFGLCGLAPDRPSIFKKKPALEAVFGQVIDLSDALVAIERTYARRPAGVSIH
jgi:hypothetical protein